MLDGADLEQLPEQARPFRCPAWRLAPTDAARGWLVTISLLLVARPVSGQDSLRNSLAADAGLEGPRQQQALQFYSFEEGNLRVLVEPSLELDYNDNVTLVKTGAQEDFILKPLLTLTGTYPVSQQNLLGFSAAAGYDEYLEHSQYSAYRVNSDSQLVFDIRVKDFSIDLHDRFSYFEDPSAEAAAAGTALYGGFQNFAGVTATWDLEDVTLTLGYDHQNFISSSGDFTYLSRASELPLGRLGLKLRPDLTVGVEGSAAFTSYDQDVLNDNQSYSAGAYADFQPGSYFHLQPRVGYTIYQFQHTSQSARIFDLTPTGVPVAAPAGESIRTADLDTWYAEASLSHAISKVASYSLDAGHEIRLGIESDAIEDYYFRAKVQWSVIKDLGLNTSIFYEHGNEGAGNVSGNLTETYNWYGGALLLTYPVMKKLLLTLSYRLTLRSSNGSFGDYAQNVAGIKLSYQIQ